MAAPPSVLNVGTFFINQYYKVLSETPEFSHQFYNNSSTITLVDGDYTHTVSNILEIYSLLTSLNVTQVEVTQLNAQNSWNRGILVIVSGILRSRNFCGKKKFTEAFFLAPQDNGFFVMNDVLQFQNEDVVIQHPAPALPDIQVDSEEQAYNPHLEQTTVPNSELEEETWEYVNSRHDDDSPIDKYSLPDEQQDEELPSETVVKEAPGKESSPLECAVEHAEDSIPTPACALAEQRVTEPVGERAKLSYASILQASKGQSSQPFVPRQTVARQSMPPPLLDQRTQPSAQQLNVSASSFVTDASSTATDGGSVQKEVELTSVYVRGLPSYVTNADLEKEFKNFGKIKPNGVFIRNKQDVGVCFAFVEFEDMSGVHHAIQASPIELLGRQVYIEERRASSNSSTRGGATTRGRGRGRGDARNPGRGGAIDGSYYNSVRGNGYQQRAYQ